MKRTGYIILLSCYILFFSIVSVTYSDVSIQKISGSPIIVKCQSDISLISMELRDISFTIKNDAETGARFTYNLLCDEISQRIELGSIYYRQGEEREVKGKVSLSATENTIIQSCVFKVTDIGSGLSSVCYFNLTVSPAIRSCSLDETFCDTENNSKVWICVKGELAKRNCQKGCNIGMQECNEDVEKNQIAFKKEEQKTTFIAIFLIVILITILLVFLFRKRK